MVFLFYVLVLVLQKATASITFKFINSPTEILQIWDRADTNLTGFTMIFFFSFLLSLEKARRSSEKQALS